MNLIAVSSPTWSLKRTWKPTGAAQRHLQFLGHAPRHRARGDPARLGAADHARPRRARRPGRAWAAGWSCPSRFRRRSPRPGARGSGRRFAPLRAAIGSVSSRVDRGAARRPCAALACAIDAPAPARTPPAPLASAGAGLPARPQAHAGGHGRGVSAPSMRTARSGASALRSASHRAASISGSEHSFTRHGQLLYCRLSHPKEILHGKDQEQESAASPRAAADPEHPAKVGSPAAGSHRRRGTDRAQHRYRDRRGRSQEDRRWACRVSSPTASPCT